MGHSKTTVDPILPNFDPLPPSSGQKWMFYILSTLCHMAPCGLSADPQPPPLVHVVIECPLISYNTVLPIITSFRLHSLKFCFKFYYRYVDIIQRTTLQKKAKKIFQNRCLQYKSSFSAHFGWARYDFLTTLKNNQLRLQNELINNWNLSP